MGAISARLRHHVLIILLIKLISRAISALEHLKIDEYFTTNRGPRVVREQGKAEDDLMKQTVLASLGLLAIAAVATPAMAADLPVRPTVKAPPYVPQAYNWSGFYFGINGGYGFGTSSWIGTDNFNINGGLVGGTAGYNWQVGQAVFGLEGDGDWSGIRGSTTTGCPAGCETRNDWLATFRGRLGYAADRFLPYVTGGLAVGDIKATTPGFPGIDTGRAGWTVGGGVEFAIAGPWTAKLEYLYVDLGSANCGFSCGTFTPDNVDLKTNIVRGGINYKF
jgi:outer membrane immunogenic protein